MSAFIAENRRARFEYHIEETYEAGLVLQGWEVKAIRAGQVQLTNPFHPGPADTLTITRPKADPVIERPTTDERSFTAALRHIHAVLRGEAAPEHTAVELSLPAARVLEQLQRLAQPAGKRR